MHSMICRTEGIRRTGPVRWQSYDGFCAVHWEARGDRAARGYYHSPDPLLMLFDDDVSHKISYSRQCAAPGAHWRPMLRGIYVPAGMPIWTQFGGRHSFAHLDLHLRRDWVLERLGAMISHEVAEQTLRAPAEVQDMGALGSIAATLADEIDRPTRGPHFAESLAVALLTGLLEPSAQDSEGPRAQGGLTPSQMRRLRQMVEEGGAHVTNATLAQAIGLSEGWFCNAFKRTTGKTPLQWRQELRISEVKECLLSTERTLADIALHHDFSDQGHLTRVFRRYEGTTPSAWRREARSGVGAGRGG